MVKKDNKGIFNRNYGGLGKLAGNKSIIRKRSPQYASNIMLSPSAKSSGMLNNLSPNVRELMPHQQSYLEKLANEKKIIVSPAMYNTPSNKTSHILMDHGNAMEEKRA